MEQQKVVPIDQNPNLEHYEQKSSENESNILVSIRVRPLNQKEVANDDIDVIRVEDNLIIILDPVEMEYVNENKQMLQVYHRSQQQRYAFDRIFKNESQEEIYDATCRQLIQPVMSGYNATVFAYGPTGTGQTYTMLGNSETRGLSVLTIDDIFDYIRRDPENQYDVKITYVQIYNEMIRDLLVPNSSYLELRDDPLKGIVIAGVNEFQAESVQQVMNLLFLGNQRRMTQATNANQTSSRSHAVFQISVNSSSRTQNTDVETMIGKLSLIDLAGSERGTVTQNRGIRLRQGAKINQSLLALANCINALGDKSKQGFFVPYRDSKLTRMLKDSLGGNCKTVMIANISPASSQFEQTINTLKYANRAKNIQTKLVYANKRLVSIHIAEYKNIINDLRHEIDQLKSKLQDQLLDPDHNDQSNQNNGGILQPIKNKHNANVNNNLFDNTCHHCGRGEDDEELQKIQQEIFENFQDRIQLRRGLMEIEEQNAMNVLEIKRRQSQVLVWRRMQEIPDQGQQGQIRQEDLASGMGGGSINNNNNSSKLNQNSAKNLPEEIKNQLKSIRTLKFNTDQNQLQKDLMNVQLMENIAHAKKIRDRIPKRIKYKDKRNFLELVIQNHVLELQNIELEINLQIQEKTIIDLKNIIESQRKIIEENNLDHLQMDDNHILSNNSFDDIDIEIEDLLDPDEQIMEVGNQEDLALDGDDEEPGLDIINNNTSLNQNISNADKQSNRIDSIQGKSHNKSQLFPEITNNQNQNLSEKNSSTKPPKIQNQNHNSNMNGNNINGGQSFVVENDEEQSMSPNQPDKQIKSKKKNVQNQPQANFNAIITGQSALNQPFNAGSNKGMPSLNKQILNQKEKEKEKPDQQQLKEKEREKELERQRDLSGLNLKGKNLVLPALNPPSNNQNVNISKQRK